MEIEGDYGRHGAVCVRGAFSPADIALATEAIEANLADLSPLAKRASSPEDGAFVEDFRSWDRISAMEAFIRNSPAAAIAGELMGATTVRLFHDHVLVKEPGTPLRTPWHQDLPTTTSPATRSITRSRPSSGSAEPDPDEAADLRGSV